MHGLDVIQRRMRKAIPIMGLNEREVQALHVESSCRRLRYQAALEGLESYCLFIGYPRSGHSLVGAMLDAHPQVAMAHELDVMKFMNAGFDREQIEYLLIENARRSAAAGRSWGLFDYRVAGQWQGRFEKLKVLGDKMVPAPRDGSALTLGNYGRLSNFSKTA